MRRFDPWMALDEEKFERWQPNLLALLNDPKLARFARWRMGLSRHVRRGEEIVSISPHQFTVPLHGNQFRGHFMSQPALQKSLYRGFKPVFWGMHAYDWALDRQGQRWVQSLIRPMRPAFGLSTLTAQPQTGGGGSNITCDGSVSLGDSERTFANLVAAASGSSSDVAGTTVGPLLTTYMTSGLFYTLSRNFTSFDTSSLGALETVSNATLSLYGVSAASLALGTTSVEVVASTQSAANNLAVGDYSKVGAVSFGSIALASWVTGFNIIVLNGSGLSAISLTGVTMLALRLGWDLVGTFSGTWTGYNNEYAPAYSADQGSYYAPTLVVTYTMPVTPRSWGCVQGV